MTAHTPMRVPEHFSRVDIGGYMRELRLHYGLSEQDVSEQLHIRLKYIFAIEGAQFDLMPGKAYARGYVHTYAEFLGLDADQVVERCFGGEMAREVQAHSIPASSDWYRRNQRYGGLLVALLLVGALAWFITRHAAENGDAITTEAVEAVPEDYLASMRTDLMPVAGNYDCLGDDPTFLGCFYAQRLTRVWVIPAALPNMAPAPSLSQHEIDGDDADEEPAAEDDATKEAKPKEDKAEAAE